MAEHAGHDVGEEQARGALAPGALVVLSLANPREKFWGMLLELSPPGAYVRGIDLGSFDNFVALLRAGEAASAGEVFFPMHRIERIEADLRNGDLPSIAERFETSVGLSAAQVFGTNQVRSVRAR